jgi:hypothetical protein
VLDVDFHRTRCVHPWLTPPYFKEIRDATPVCIYGKLTHWGYVECMVNLRKWTREVGALDDEQHLSHARTSGRLASTHLSPVGAALLVEPASAADYEANLGNHQERVWEELLSRQEWQLACRVAASKGLSKSERLPQFLLYVCELQLLGRAHEITEQRIGTQIFNRPANYNPGEDNIVRSYARLLRKRLDAYFEGEGSNEPMRILIPRGGYAPVFQSSPQVQSEIPEPVSTARHTLDSEEMDGEEPESLPPDAAMSRTLSLISPPVKGERNPAHNPTASWRRAGFSGLVGLTIGVLLTAAGWFAAQAVQSNKEQEPAHAVWDQLFQHNRNTLIVPTDSGLGILQNLTGHLVNIEEYASGSYLSDMHLPQGLDERNLNDLRRERYTSVVSLNITSVLTRLPEFIANRTQVRYARSITAEDIKNSNVILLGSKHTNPWVSLFETRLNFKLEYTPDVDEQYVLNEHPIGAEQKFYRNSTGTTSNHTYGAIAYLPSLDGAGHVMIIQGLNMAATQAAADTLFDPAIIKPVLQQATLPNGKLRPFELLVETTSIGATAPGARLIATRIWPQ